MDATPIRCQKCGSIYPSTDQQCPTCGAGSVGLGLHTTEVHVDRIAVREMVEDIFRSQLLYHQNLLDTQPHLTPAQSRADVENYVQRLFDRAEATASLMPPEQAAAFRKMVEEEYLYLVREFDRDRDGILRKFGIVMNRPAPQPVYQRQGIGEMAVRTAVRATIWELIFSLFRR